MPFSGSTFTLPVGATGQVAGNIVQSATWNAIHADLNTGLTQLMAQLVSTPGNRNVLFSNGSLDIWQRGAGSSASIAVAASTTAYTADRWYVTTGANQASVISAATALSNSSVVAGKVLRNAGQTGVTAYTFGYPLEVADIVRMLGQKVSLSCIVKAGANWSPTNGTLTASLYTGTAAAAKRGGGFTGETQVLTVSTNLTVSVTTAIAATSTVIVPTTTTQAELQFTWTPVGTAGADDSITIDDVQLEANLSVSTWTPTNFDIVPFTVCLADCKRHYKKTFPYGTAPAQSAGLVGALVEVTQGVSKLGVLWTFESVELRANPSVTTYNPQGATANWQDITAAASLAATIDTTTTSNSPKTIYIGGATVAAIDHQVFIHVTASSGI